MKSLTISLAAASLLFLVPAGPVAAIEKGTQKAETSKLKPGEFVWQPQASPKGSVDIVISLAEQKLDVYRDGVPIGRSTISSGRKGRATPTGIFMILEKNLTHHSNKYHEASMPYMERLTWSGLAIHAGNLPGYPESHGCVHVPLDFAKKLYAVTEEGDTVLIANGKAQPGTTSDPNLLLVEPPAALPAPEVPPVSETAPGAAPAGSAAPDASPAPAEKPAFIWNPRDVANGPYSIVLTSADKHISVYRKGVEIGRADILGGVEAGVPLGNHVYVALTATLPDGTHQWSMLGSGDGSPAINFQELARNLVVAPGFRQRLQTIIAPGTTLVITDQPANPTKPSHPD